MMELLYQALETEYGIKVSTNDLTNLRQKLYSLRRDNPAFNELSFCASPTNPTGELWIVRNSNATPAF